MFTEILLVGVIASIITQWMKKASGTNAWKMKLLAVAVSVVFGTIYYFLRDTVLWENILGVLMISSTVYAFFMK